MTGLAETILYEPLVYELEITDPVIGGPTGISNIPHEQLANRTAYLKQHVDALEAAILNFALINSQVFTGTPSSPTQALGDNSTKLATDAFVQGTVGGVLSKSIAGGVSATLSAVEAGHAILELTGIITADVPVIVPSNPTRSWIVNNLTTGPFAVTIKHASGTGTQVSQGKINIVYSNGTNILPATTDILASILAVDGAGSGIDADLLDGQHGSYYAPLNSPSFTGTPAAPTAAPGTSTTQLASTKFVADSFAPLSSPTLTDIPKSPTAAPGTSTTQIASTAFVMAALTAAVSTISVFPTGTRMPFAQAAAPAGWTQDVSDAANNRMLRVVNTAGGSIAGTHSPILNNVVPAHTHGFVSGIQSNDHTHGFTSGAESADHAHYTTTGGASANHVHYDAGHVHTQYQATSEGSGGSAGWNGAYWGTKSSGVGYASLGGMSADHSHAGWSGGRNAAHTHSGTTNGMNLNHTHSGSTDNGSSQTDWVPRYIDMIICSKY